MLERNSGCRREGSPSKRHMELMCLWSTENVIGKRTAEGVAFVGKNNNGNMENQASERRMQLFIPFKKNKENTHNCNVLAGFTRNGICIEYC